MVEYPETTKIQEILDGAKSVVVVQADNPDTDSLASALALEHILEEQGKKVYLYCGVDLPSYLSYLPGADRVSTELPKNFDASIIVDTSSDGLLEKMSERGEKNWLAAKPSIVIDHHATPPTISFASVICNHKAVATGEVIYEIARQQQWKLNKEAQELLTIAILADSLGLMSEATSARSIHIIAQMVENGVNLAELDNARRETMRRDPELIYYKGRLLERVEFYGDNRIATITIPWEEIEQYSPLYNPPMLIIDDMRLAQGTDIAIAFKVYKDGRVTAKIRCNYGKGIADKLAEHFGGGGHSYAAGFKITDGTPFEEIKSDTIAKALELLKEKEAARETA